MKTVKTLLFLFAAVLTASSPSFAADRCTVRRLQQVRSIVASTLNYADLDNADELFDYCATNSPNREARHISAAGIREVAARRADLDNFYRNLP